MRFFPYILLSAALFFTGPAAQSPQIGSFFAIGNRCDYLILTPDIFSEGAAQLAQYRNGFSGDDVTEARYVVLESLFAEYRGVHGAPDSILQESISWALDNWEKAPLYVVFIGDDSVKNSPGAINCGHRGPMPTHIMGYRITSTPLSDATFRYDTIYEYSDDWFVQTCIDSSNSFSSFTNPCLVTCGDPPVAFGRIPCERKSDFDRYLDKVRRYETSRCEGAWRNRVLLLADDRYDNGDIDHLNHASFLYAAEQLLTGRFSNCVFLDDFTSFGPVGNSLAKERLVSAINDGVDWTICFAHGSPAVLTEEHVLCADDYSRFENTSMPTIFFSLGCANGGFYAGESVSMCKRYLFSTDGGAIAYIANPNTTIYPYSFPILRRALHLRDSLPAASIGKIVALAKKNVCCSSGKSFQVLGDPAVSGGRSATQLDMRINGDGEILCSIPSGMESGSLYWELSRRRSWRDSLTGTTDQRDSVLCFGGGTFSGTTYRIAVPEISPSKTLRLTAFAWNGVTDARGFLFMCNAATTSLPPPVVCSFESFTGDTLRSAVYDGDSVITAVSGLNTITQWKRDLSGYSQERLVTRLSEHYVHKIECSSGGNLLVHSQVAVGGVIGQTVQELDRNGVSRWSFSDTSISGVTFMHECFDGGYLIGSSVDPFSGSTLVRLDGEGKLLWRRNLATHISSIVSDSSFGFYFTGSIRTTAYNPGSAEYALQYGMIEDNGRLLYTQTIQNGRFSSGSIVKPSASDRRIIVGSLTTDKSVAAWILCVNGYGDTVWTRTFDNVTPISCLTFDNGTVAVSGSTEGDGVVAFLDRDGNDLHSMRVLSGSVRLLHADNSPNRLIVACGKSSFGESLGMLTGNNVDIRNGGVRRAAHSERFRAALLPVNRVLFSFGQSAGSIAAVEIFDLRGVRIEVVLVPAGSRSVVWNCSRIAAGTYISRFRNGSRHYENDCFHKGNP